MIPTLSQRQRLIVAVVYLTVLWAVYMLIGRTIPQSNEHAIFWFYSAALMIVLGRYVVEPFFTTPADAIVNALTLLITLGTLSASDRSALFGYTVLWYYGLSVMALGAVAIFTKDFRQAALQYIARASYGLTELMGKAHVIFTFLYLTASWSFFAVTGDLGIFILAIALWICVIFLDIVGKTVSEVTRLFAWLRRSLRAELGHAIGCDNPLLYKVEVDYTKYKGREPRYGDVVAIETRTNEGSLGMVVARKHLLGKCWLSVYLLTSPEGDVIALDLRAKKLTAEPKSIFAADNTAFLIDLASDLNLSDRGRIEQTALFAYKQDFVGYITKDSNINTVSFIILSDPGTTGREITEGVILKTTIYGEDTLYQVINGNTREEHLAGFDTHGYTVGVARKLGKYNSAEHELETRKWMPRIYAPLFAGYRGQVPEARIAQIAQDAIGRLPETDLDIPIKDLDAIVTHNTAILGILGIGKSCLAFELIKKIVASGVKVVCIDITNQYNTPEGLRGYLGDGLIDSDLEEAQRKELKATKEDKKLLIEGNPQASGNSSRYEEILNADIKTFMESQAAVKIYNPDWHGVSKGVAFKNTTLEDLTVAEKTRIIAERLFRFAMNQGESTRARYLLVMEEAHSLVPERNSVASDGDKNATNGTAKVILQGRKYGLGSMVITQRTANVSKSILNQCNTIFAMRVFDDTGKTFLENYIGSDYADTLPTLEERHAVAIGKGLKLKQPVILRLNEKADVLQSSAVASEGAVIEIAADPQRF